MINVITPAYVGNIYTPESWQIPAGQLKYHCWIPAEFFCCLAQIVPQWHEGTVKHIDYDSLDDEFIEGSLTNPICIDIDDDPILCSMKKEEEINLSWDYDTYMEELCDAVRSDVLGVLFCFIPREGCAQWKETHE